MATSKQTPRVWSDAIRGSEILANWFKLGTQRGRAVAFHRDDPGWHDRGVLVVGFLVVVAAAVAVAVASVARPILAR